jgi:hypothetical protein
MVASAELAQVNALAAPAVAYANQRPFAIEAGLKRGLLLFIKQDGYLEVMRANHSLAGCPAERRSGGALGKTPKQLGAGQSCRFPADGVNTIF